MIAAVAVRGGGDGVAASTSSAPAAFLIEATVPAVDDAPVCTVPHAGVDLTRDYFPVSRFTRPPVDAPAMVEAVAAIVFAPDRLVA